ncbi:MAG: hypothetical protein IPK16_20515 [Anaerolineales bacterium]|nr:hypothetical protein [Anaerolineales bacterium]
MDVDRAVPDPEWEGGITPGVYMTRAMLGEAGMDWPDADIKRMVKEYAPEQEIVVAILGDGGTRIFIVRRRRLKHAPPL